MIHLLLNDDLFSCTNAVQNIRLIVIISVNSSAKELLLRVGVLLESLGESEDRVGRGGLQL